MQFQLQSLVTVRVVRFLEDSGIEMPPPRGDITRSHNRGVAEDLWASDSVPPRSSVGFDGTSTGAR